MTVRVISYVALLLSLTVPAWGAISFVAGATNTTTSSVAGPAGILAGDVIIVAFPQKNADTLTVTSGGLTKLCTTYYYTAGSTTVSMNNGQFGTVYYRIATSADAGGIATYAVSGSTQPSAAVVVFRGIDNADQVLDSFNCQGNPSSAIGGGAGTGTSMKTTTLDSMFGSDEKIDVFFPESTGNSGTITGPGDETLGASVAPASGHGGVWIGYKAITGSTILTNPGYIAGESASQSVSDTWASVSIAIKPASPIFGGSDNTTVVDVYGGTPFHQCITGTSLNAPASGGPNTHAYMGTAANHHFVFCDPLGDVLWSRGLVLDVPSSGNVPIHKYDVGPWAATYSANGGFNNTANQSIEAIRRLRRWGQTLFDQGSNDAWFPFFQQAGWTTTDTAPPLKADYAFDNLLSRTSMGFDNATIFQLTPPVENLRAGVRDIFSTSSAFFRSPDYYAPRFATGMTNFATWNVTNNAIFLGIGSLESPHSDYFLYNNWDETDDTWWEKSDDTAFTNYNATSGATSLGHYPNLPIYVLINDPMAPVEETLGSGRWWFGTYSDSELYSKIKEADILATRYAAQDCTGAGTPFAACSGTGTTTPGVYGSVDPSCTGTPPTYCMGDAFIGSTEVTNATTRLNAAWGANVNYSSLWTSDTHCQGATGAQCFQNGTYAAFGDTTATLTCSGSTNCSGLSCTGTVTPIDATNGLFVVAQGTGQNAIIANRYGVNSTTIADVSSNGLGICSSPASSYNTSTHIATVWPKTGSPATLTVYFKNAAHSTGTGLIDEDGSCPSKVSGNCWIPANIETNTTMNAAAQADLNAFHKAYVDHYAGLVGVDNRAMFPGILEYIEGGPSGAPPTVPVLQEFGSINPTDLDFIMIDPMPPFVCNVSGTACAATATTLLNYIATNYGEKPIVDGNSTIFADCDSTAASIAIGCPSSSGSVFATQAARGTGYQTMINQALTSADAAGNYPVAGETWIFFYDGTGTGLGLNLGFVTLLDNPYDGHCSVNSASPTDTDGFPCGNESASTTVGNPSNTGYGDFIDPATVADNAVYATIFAVGGSSRRIGAW